MRDVKALHPRLQEKIADLLALCKKNKIEIAIGECVRTAAEQDALYAKGRTTAGSIVTNAKGSSYSSQHQWGIAVDFFLKMDIDGDGSVSDDAFNNAKKTFNKVGTLAKSIGLGWGGDWKSPVDLPHLYLPDWGSTASQLKTKYSTPDKFMATWKSTSSVEKQKEDKVKDTKTLASKTKTDAAQRKDKKYNGTFVVTAKDGLRLRSGAGTDKSIVNVLPFGAVVKCYGYYTEVKGTVWLYVEYGKYTGFVSKDYVK